MGRLARAGARGRGADGRAGAHGGRPARGGARVLNLLIREEPATELTVATRILAHLGMLAPDGRVAALVGSEVVYVAARGVSVSTMTPYDVCALRLGDATVLAGSPPDDAARYIAMLRTAGSRAVAATREADVSAPSLAALVERVSGLRWDEAEASARGAGALVGAYPAGVAD